MRACHRQSARDPAAGLAMVSNLALLTVTSLLVTVHACRGAAGVVQVQWCHPRAGGLHVPACPRGASRGKMLQARLHIAVYRCCVLIDYPP